MMFDGFHRKDGTIGIRNIPLVLPVGQCANELAARIAEAVPEAFPLLHTQPCAHLGSDNISAEHCLIGVGRNPNVSSALVVGIGCDAFSAKDVAEKVGETGKPVHWLTLESCGTFDRAITQGHAWLTEQATSRVHPERVRARVPQLVIGVKCGGSDATSALAGNPAIGHVVDRLVDRGGTVVFSETTELIGAEDLLSQRAANANVRDQLLGAVKATEDRIRSTGVDPRGTQPTPGNIRGGLSTLEEKSLGGVLKTGSRPIAGAFPWGEAPSQPGLHFMDCPANVPQLLLGWAAAGAQLLLFSVGGGLPARIPSLIGTNLGALPVLPILKVLSNPRDEQHKGYFDIFAGAILQGSASLDTISDRIYQRIAATASGEKTVLERHPMVGHQIWELLVRGPTV